VTNLAFANDDVFWISWKHSAEKHVPNLRHTNEAIDGYVTAGAGFICIAISSAWARQLSIAIQKLSSTLSPKTNLISFKQGTNWAK